MVDYLIMGITLGFAAGISPGPLLVLVMSETIKYNSHMIRIIHTTLGAQNTLSLLHK